MYNLWILWAMIYIPSWTTKKHKKKLFPGHYIQSWKKFKDFSRTSPKIQGLLKTVWTLCGYYPVSFESFLKYFIWRSDPCTTLRNNWKLSQQSATELLRLCTQIGSFQRTKECTTLPPPLHTKLGCLLFSAGSSNSGTNIAWRGWGRKSFTVPLSLKSVTRQKASLG